MKISRTRVLVPVSFALMLGAALTFGASEPQDVQLESFHVAGGISYINNPRAGNVGVSIGDDGVLIIDDQFANVVSKIEAQIEKLAGSKKDPVFLINTHWHGDHTGGNAELSDTATIFAHVNVRRRLSGDATIEGRTETSPAAALPVVTYDDGLSIHFNGEEIRLFHVPFAHTDGDTVVWFTGSNVVHMGDLYFQLGYPFIDLSSGGNVQGLIEGLQGVLERIPTDAKIIPGHGEQTGVDGLREYLAMIETITERVREQKALGATVEEMMGAGITKDYDERWGGFAFVPNERFVQSIFESLGS